MGNDESRPPKKPYEKPTVTKLTREQAKLKLMGCAMMGDDQAKELLEILFHHETPEQKKQPYEKPTMTEMTREQAQLKLMGQAMMGSEEAKELLEMFFGNKKQKNDDTEHKKSA